MKLSVDYIPSKMHPTSKTNWSAIQLENGPMIFCKLAVDLVSELDTSALASGLLFLQSQYESLFSLRDRFCTQ